MVTLKCRGVAIDVEVIFFGKAWLGISLKIIFRMGFVVDLRVVCRVGGWRLRRWASSLLGEVSA